MQQDFSLVGLWSADVMYPPAAQSDDWLLFFADGTGRLDFINPSLSNAWSFRWSVVDEKNLHIIGVQSYHYDNKLVSEPWPYDQVHSITVGDEITPRGTTMRVIRFEEALVQGLSDHFAFCRPDVEDFVEPEFSSYK